MTTDKTEDENTPIETLFERAEAFGKTSLELYRLKAIEKLATIVSDLVSNILLIVCFSFFFMLLNIGIALWIGDAIGHTYHGFLIVAGFYLFAFILLYAIRNSAIKMPISKSIIDKSIN